MDSLREPPPRVETRRSLDPSFDFGVAGLVLAAHLGLVGWMGSPMPRWDEWDAHASFLFEPWREGTFRWSSLLAPHNEHRIFFTRSLALLLLECNGIWDPRLEMIVGALLVGLTALALCTLLGQDLRRSAKLTLGVAIVATMAFPFGWENTLGALQTCFFASTFLAILAIAGLTHRQPLSMGWWAALVLAAAASVSLGSGALAAAAGGAGMILLRARDASGARRTAAGILVLSAALVASSLVLPITARPAMGLPSVEMLVAFCRLVAWPFAGAPWMAAALVAPCAILLVRMLRRPGPPSPAEATIVALGVWALLQAAAIASRRTVTSDVPSRYVDLLVIGLLANVSALLRLADGPALGANRRARVAAGLGLTGLGCALVSLLLGPVAEHLTARQALDREQEKNVRAYVLDGEPRHIQGKPLRAIPYPDGRRLAELLDDPTIRDILPTALRAPREGRVVANEGAGFEAGGRSPEDVFRPGERAWSARDPRPGEAPARLEVAFDSPPRFGGIELAVAGNPGDPRAFIRVFSATEREPIAVLRPKSPGGWTRHRVAMPPGPFRIVAEAGSGEGSLVVADPRDVGRLAAAIDWVLGDAGAIAAGATALVWWAIRRRAA